MNKTKKQKTYTQYIRFKLLFIFGVGLLAIAVALFDISYGASGMSIWDVIKTIFGQGTEKMNSIVWSIRLPRVVTALVAGLGLSIVGCVLQSVLRNPLADASTLGVSQGAAFGASFSVVIIIRLPSGSCLKRLFMISMSWGVKSWWSLNVNGLICSL